MIRIILNGNDGLEIDEMRLEASSTPARTVDGALTALEAEKLLK
jgi:hypothetical protein